MLSDLLSHTRSLVADKYNQSLSIDIDNYAK